MGVIELVEYGEPVLVSMPESIAAGLQATGLVEVIPDRRAGFWTIRPQGKVGAVAVDSFEVRVAPKVSINRIIFLLGYTVEGLKWQQEAVEMDSDIDVAHIMAEVFLRSTGSALKAGLLQGYSVKQEALHVVRGRVLIDEQLKQRPGSWLPIEVSYDDFTADIAENQLLLAAIDRLMRNPRIPKSVRRRLAAMKIQFADVSRLVPGTALPTWLPSRLNKHYQNALRLASIILAASSFEQRRGDLRISGLVLDMPKIFEDFLTKALEESIIKLWPGSCVRGQFRSFLDDSCEIPMRPDVVWLSGSGDPLAVIDAKYKYEKVSGFPNADFYQVLSYAVSMGLNSGHLVYAKGSEIERVHSISRAGVKISTHTINLESKPAVLLAEVQELARRIGTQYCIPKVVS